MYASVFFLALLGCPLNNRLHCPESNDALEDRLDIPIINKLIATTK